MKIAFVIKSLANPGGGAERVLAQVASGLAGRGHEVVVFTNDPPERHPYYAFSDSVTIIPLDIGNTSVSLRAMSFFESARKYRRAALVTRPDVFVGFMHSAYIPLGFGLIGLSIPVVASEHIGPEHYVDRPIERMLLYMAPILGRRITVVSEQIRDSFGPWMRRKMVVAENPVTIGRSVATQKARDGRTNLVLLTVGRLTRQKDQRVLISAFAKIADHFPEWILRIVGEGDLRTALEMQVEDLGLQGRVELPGTISDIDAEYGLADLFVLPSSYESFGLATAEALLHGLPAVGFADCPGTNILILDGLNGRLVSGSDRVQALADVLAPLMADPVERGRLSRTSGEFLAAKHGLDKVVSRWERILREAVSGS